MKNAILIPGLIAGVVLALLYFGVGLLAEGMSYGAREVLGLAVMLLVVALAQAIAVRRHPLRSAAAYPARYFAAMLSGGVTAFVFGVMAWLYFAVIDPRYLPRFFETYLERARARGATDAEREQFAAAAEQMRAFVLDPFSQATVQFGTVLMLALLAAILVAALIRPEDTRD